MAVFLDSADLPEAQAAAALGFVRGITTNPALMVQGVPPLERLAALLAAFPAGPVFYQPRPADAPGAEAEGRAALALAPGRVVIKLPATRDLFGLAALLSAEGAACAMTAVYSPAQALLAHAAGCRWVIPYVDRAARLMAGGERLVPALAAALRGAGSQTVILAASLKSPEQAAEAVARGAGAVTVPMEVLLAMAEHPLSASAIAEFGAALSGMGDKYGGRLQKEH